MRSAVCAMRQKRTLRNAQRTILERDIPVFLGRVGVALVLEHLQGVNQARTSFLRLDDIIDIAALRRHIRICEFLAVIRHQLGLARGRVFGLVQLPAEDDIDRPFGPITAISAVGQAKFTSPRMCLDDMTQYAPPYALRVMTVSFGTVASQ